MRKHYILCQHGLFGNKHDFECFQKHFDGFPDEKVHAILLLKNSSPAQTLDGIVKAGVRCYNEIQEFVITLDPDEECNMSFLGHSMGGLILRSALRKIEKEDPELWTRHKITRKLAIFLATPHLGISGSASWLIRMTSQHFLRHLSRTASDLTLSSPDLIDLCDDAGMRSLNVMERVILIANVSGDRLVSAESALIVSHITPPALQQGAGHADVIIVEYCHPVDVKVEDAIKPDQQAIIDTFNLELPNLSRYLVAFPQSYPSFFKHFDNTAHAKIVCHGWLDSARTGFPVVKHVAELLNKNWLNE
jgi:hypothetical protein